MSFKLGEILLQNGNQNELKESQMRMEQSIKKKAPSEEELLILAKNYVKTGKIEEAIKIYKNVIKAYEDKANYDSYAIKRLIAEIDLLLGDIAFNEGNFKESIIQFNQCKGLDKNNKFDVESRLYFANLELSEA